jgi:hypothetical protein
LRDLFLGIFGTFRRLKWRVRNAVPYSSAPRCPTCQFRAIIDEQAARMLTAASGDILLSFECPEGYGTHVWNPDFERAHTSR